MNERVLQSNNVMGNRSAVLADEAPKHDLREARNRETAVLGSDGPHYLSRRLVARDRHRGQIRDRGSEGCRANGRQAAVLCNQPLPA